MIRKLKIYLSYMLMILLTVSVMGCMDSRDINKKMIATTIAVDKKDGKVWFYLEVANIQEGQGGEAAGGSISEKYILIKANGDTMTEAREHLERQLDQPLYLSGARTLLLTEDFAKEDLLEYLYRVRSDQTYRKKVITIITRDNLDELFKTLNEKNSSVGYSIEHTITALDESGESFSRSTSRLLENLSDAYTGILIPCIGLHDKETALVGYSVVNDTKVTGFIPVEESMGLIMMKADNTPTVYNVLTYEDYKYTIETILKKRKIKVSNAFDKISYVVSFDFEATLKYSNKKAAYKFEDAAIEEMSAMLKEMIEEELVAAVEQAQTEYKTDYLQLDDAFRIKYPVEFETMDWQEEFSKVSVEFDVNVDLTAEYKMD